MHIEEESFSFQRWFWNEKFWLPKGFGWEELKNVDQPLVFYHLFFYSIPAAFLIIALRNVFKKKISLPIAKLLGIKDKDKTVPIKCDNNNIFSEKGCLPNNKDKPNGLSLTDSIEEWESDLQSSSQDNKTSSSPLKKFSDAHWKFLWYSFSSFYGFYILSDQVWFWDVLQCWKDFPLQDFPETLKWYFIITTSFTLTQLQSSLSDRGKKDFWEHVIHDVTTILLLAIAYASNFLRMGALTIVLHEISDIWLNFCKLCFYTKKKMLGDLSFLMFTFVWVVSRLIIFPYIIIYSYLYAPRPKDFQLYPSMAIVMGMLLVLLILHIVWTYYIYKILIRVVLPKTETKREKKC